MMARCDPCLPDITPIMPSSRKDDEHKNNGNNKMKQMNINCTSVLINDAFHLLNIRLRI